MKILPSLYHNVPNFSDRPVWTNSVDPDWLRFGHEKKIYDILKYCGLGRYNPGVVVSNYRRRAR